MGRNQWIAVALTAVLLVVTYWGCPVRPPEMEEGFQRGPLETTGLESLIRAARADLNPAEVATLASLESRLADQEDPEKRLPLLEQLAGEWYRAGHPEISGIYARDIAEETATEDAWGIAGTTFSLCLQQEALDEKTKQFCSTQAERAYQAAISLNPDNADHRINLALTYTNNPGNGANPMQGILMLRELTEQYPDNPRVFTTLAQLAIRTNQWDKAAERLQQAYALAPDDPDVVCNLARVYETLKQMDRAAELGARCQELVK